MGNTCKTLALVGVFGATGCGTPEVCRQEGLNVNMLNADVSWTSVYRGTDAEYQRCVDAVKYDRDCGSVRDAGLEIRQNLLDWFYCDSDGDPTASNPYLSPESFYSMIDVANRNSVGDCSTVVDYEKACIGDMLERISCDADGQLYEQLERKGTPRGLAK
ncbi:MAG: hypothetical protein UV80_C0002G0115 [Candidatus Peregrinibacteria bacterium GW2011_GWF2_43_17]|nr:MAG: hypothetical protein UV80_C0002G0115 [Candidatus Peregrinibacteria bacterium GW2011_GWF2_43_17]KKT18530.1 MAG: hypothetical protein UW03_C0039G0003 [Candidatus Peregrinibacteria bacterium GW2011_GWA2_43_8]HAU39840.1 hypothetical protein [Candidatus Peregrinibacteria bacterium]